VLRPDVANDGALPAILVVIVIRFRVIGMRMALDTVAEG
jgi:hypothetical protein